MSEINDSKWIRANEERHLRIKANYYKFNYFFRLFVLTWVLAFVIAASLTKNVLFWQLAYAIPTGAVLAQLLIEIPKWEKAKKQWKQFQITAGSVWTTKDKKQAIKVEGVHHGWYIQYKEYNFGNEINGTRFTNPGTIHFDDFKKAFVNKCDDEKSWKNGKYSLVHWKPTEKKRGIYE